MYFSRTGSNRLLLCRSTKLSLPPTGTPSLSLILFPLEYPSVLFLSVVAYTVQLTISTNLEVRLPI